MKKFIFSLILISATALFAADEKDKCIYCGSTAFGYCSNSPAGVHTK